MAPSCKHGHSVSQSWQDVHAAIRQDIISEKIPVGTRLPTEVELAEQTGLSRLTVRNIYNRLAAEGLVRRVRRRGTFVRSNRTVRHRAKGLNIVFLVGLQLGHPRMQKSAFWPGRALIGLEEGAHAHGDAWIYVTENANAPAGQVVPELVNMDKADGVISYVIPGDEERENLAGYLDALGKPHVVLNEHFTAHGANCVVEDCESGMKALVGRAAELGHYHLVFCMTETAYTVYPARLDAFKAAVTEAGLPLYPPILSPGPNILDRAEHMRVHGTFVGRKILEMAQRPTAVVCAADVLALGVVQFFRSQGISVPHDISVTGYDGLPEAKHSSPPLTTVEEDLVAMGREAVECLHRMVEDDAYRGVKIKVPVKPIFRESLGPAPR